MSAAPVLAAERVAFGYGTAPVLGDVSVALHAGELVGLIGPNGAGKTTLVRLLAGVVEPRAGRVLLDGGPLAARSRRERARALAFVPQDPRVEFPFTALEIVLMGRAPYLDGLGFAGARDLALARGALEHLELAGLEGRTLDALSGGERQRVFLARALVQEPRVLLLDEPTTHLDVRHQASILEVVRRRVRANGLAALAVLHDLNLAAIACDRLVLLDGGRIAVEGRASDVLTPEHLATAFGARVHVGRPPADAGPVVLPLPLRDA
jgi:iron complex transport system ATP-binding protein